MTRIEIKSHWDNSKILYVAENASDIRDAVDQAVKEKADLREADLSEADLRDADLSDADLRWADLRNADLSWANLSGVDLRWANLSWAYLSGVDLHGVNLPWWLQIIFDAGVAAGREESDAEGQSE